MSNEISWNDIPEFEGYYQINNLGEIRSSHKRSNGKLLAVSVDRNGYIKALLSKNGKSYTRYIHRLLAILFIPLKEGKVMVNHKNGVKTDNRLENLEWVDRSENMRHAYAFGLMKLPSKSSVKVIDTLTGEIYDSIISAARANNRSYTAFKKRIRKDKRFIMEE